MREAPVKTTGYRQGITTVATERKERLGTLRILEDGRKFRYSLAGGDLTVGQATVAAVANSNHINKVVTTLNTSRTQVQVTVSAGTAIASNALAGGYLQVNTGTGGGRVYRIDSNTALTSSGTTITLTLTDRMAESGSTTRVSLFASPYSGVTASTTEEGLFTGIAQVAVASGKYFWAQTGGPAIALIDGTPAVGTMMIRSDTAGALEAMNATLDVDQPVVGIMWGTVGVDTQFKPVMLIVD